MTVDPLDDQERKEDLQPQTPGDGTPANGAAIGGKNVGDRQKDGESEESGKSGQRHALRVGRM